MIVADFEPLTLTDFPGRVATLAFLYGCNLRCRFCYNKELVLSSSNLVDKTEEFFNYLFKNNIKNVAITGGEPLFNKNIVPFLEKLKMYDISTKLDTHGFSYKRLKEVINKKLVDFIAMDIKGFTDKDIKYITRTNFTFDDFLRSYRLLKNSGIEYELRITMWKTFDEKEVEKFFQSVDSEKVVLQKPILDKPLLDKRFKQNLKKVNIEKNIKIFERFNTKIRNFY